MPIKLTISAQTDSPLTTAVHDIFEHDEALIDDEKGRIFLVPVPSTIGGSGDHEFSGIEITFENLTKVQLEELKPIFRILRASIAALSKSSATVTLRVFEGEDDEIYKI